MRVNMLMIETLGYALSSSHDQLRCTGRSLGQAFEAIGFALRNPGSEVKIRDHFGTSNSDIILFQKVKGIVEDFGLEFITFGINDLTITYNPFKEMEILKEDIVVDGIKYRRVYEG